MLRRDADSTDADPTGTDPTDTDLDGRVVLLTGGTSGLGREAVLALADRGASVAVVGRNREAGRAVRREIDARNGDGWAECYRVDLASLDAVRDLAAEFRDRHGRLDALVNNAGVYRTERTETEDGYETTFAVNHLAPVLLTHELLPTLGVDGREDGPPGRVVVTASGLHRRGDLRFDDLFRAHEYDGRGAYAASKLANVLFVRELARRLEAEGSDAVALAADPGFVPSTALSRSGSLRARAALDLFSRLPLPFTNDLGTGASALVRCVADTELASDSGTYVAPDGPTDPADRARDDAVARRLWDVSSGLVGVSPDGWV
ncbi:SDR family oxidoreductase [Halobium salinum]|uniref:SDR family oxidoreductase n=1 Tax=Halobium salinum TaxID=1364940 RepID=A0ABD5PCR7_9EURY|nr:SDR family oxidoreductase [Halobium salinum]